MSSRPFPQYRADVLDLRRRRLETADRLVERFHVDAQGRHRRSLLHEPEKREPTLGIGAPPVIDQPPPGREHRAGRNAQPALDEPDGGGFT